VIQETVVYIKNELFEPSPKNIPKKSEDFL